MMQWIALDLVLMNSNLLKFYQSYYCKSLLLRTQDFGATSTNIDIPLWQEMNEWHSFDFCA